MKNLSIRIKYAIPMAVTIVAIVVILLANSILIAKLENDVETFTDRFLPAVTNVLNADRDLYQARLAELQYLTFSEGKEAYLSDLKENAEQAQERFLSYSQLLEQYPEIAGKLKSFDAAYSHWMSSVNANLQRSDASSALMATEQSFESLREIYDTAGELAITKAHQLRSEASAKVAQQKKLVWTLSLAAIAVAVIFTVISQNKLIARIDEITDNIKDITSGGGDLTHEIDVVQKDELGTLGLAFNDFVRSLRELVSQVGSDVNELQNYCGVLDSSSTKSSDVVLQQSKSVEMIVSAVHQMSIATREMSEIAQNTASETEVAMTQSEEGVETIKKSVEQIQAVYHTIESASNGAKQLVEESNNISSVLDVIRGIAEQTNLLALNAAIEAARAGEQGRGFAVVADEVRTLASKTQESTDSIQKMIEAVQHGVSNVVSQIEDGFEKVSSSVDLASSIETRLSETQVLIGKVRDMSTQTATATEEQSSVSEEINTNLHELSTQTSITNEIATETHESAQQVRKVSSSIYEGVKRFKTA
ncbi:methyl-accepting chemotaxis protein [Alteromonadaceae bacterium Bs31]|nr:methyl-accepting chemotaxis protein [Alteromonadaceae bacterium Bs31]